MYLKEWISPLLVLFSLNANEFTMRETINISEAEKEGFK